MKNSQNLTPKYWMVHDVTTDDVFIDTASKTYKESVMLFLKNHDSGFHPIEESPELEDFYAAFHSLDQSKFRCELMSIESTEVA